MTHRRMIGLRLALSGTKQEKLVKFHEGSRKNNFSLTFRGT